VSETEYQRHDVLDRVLRFGAEFKDGEPALGAGMLSSLVPRVARWIPTMST
jgi:hypothetical protein